MPHFELGGCVSLTADQKYSSDFAKELAKESSIVCDAAYKSDFATELLETSVTKNISTTVEAEDESNIYENLKVRESFGSGCPQNSFFENVAENRRLSQVSQVWYTFYNLDFN